MSRRLNRFLCIVLTILATGASLSAQVDPLELLKKFNEPEAPPAFMSMAINDTAVELFLQGSWKSYWGDYLGFGGMAGAPVSMTGFSHTPWSNSVDFLLSLWIQRHYFFETNLSDGFNFRSFALGYASIDGPGLNKLMVANNGIDIPAYPYLTLGKSANDVPGILAEWSTEFSRHFAMIRLLNRNTIIQYFRGTSAQLTSKTATNSFIQGRFFQLPYSNLAAIRVWVQSNTGSLASDGYYYRLLGAQDILFMDLQRGTIGLLVAATTRVLIGWDTTGSSSAQYFPDLSAPNILNTIPGVQFDGLNGGSNFFTKVVTPLISTYGFPTSSAYVSTLYPQLSGGNAGLVINIPGNEQDALLVHAPGLFSIFQDYSWYPRPQGLTPTGATLDTGDDASLNTGVVADLIHLGYIGASGLAFRYPFMASTYTDKTRLYLPGYQAGAEQFLEWKGSGAASPNGIVLDQDPLPESIIVTRNGLPETGFTWNSGTKSLVFIQPVQANESITVTYDLASRIGGSRTLQFAQGNTWNPSDSTKIEAALGLDWPIEQAASGTTGTNVGKIMTGSSFSFNLPADKLSGEVALGGSLNIPGAAGAQFLQDFSGGYFTVGLTGGMLFPSALPQVSFLNSLSTQPGFFIIDSAPAVTLNNRGQLLYKNYNAGNGSMTAWNATAQTSYPYASGNPTGPYLAGSAIGDPFSGTVAVADLVMSAAASENWVAFDMRLSPDQRQALIKTGTIWFYLRTDSLTQPVDLYLQAGRLAEDIDGSGQIGAGTVGAPGFPFRDAYHGSQTMIAGFDFLNTVSSTLSKDVNGNGVLDAEQNPYARYLGNFSAGAHSGWQLVNLLLSDSDRLRLQAGYALRIVALRGLLSAGDISGRILVGQIHFDLPGMTATASGAAAGSAGLDTDLSRQLTLGATFPDAIRATDSPAQGRLDWTQGTGTVMATQIVNGSSLYDNRYIRIHIQPLNLNGFVPVRLNLVLDDVGNSQSTMVNCIKSPDIYLTAANNGQWLRAEFDVVSNSFSLKNGAGTIISQGSSQIVGHPHVVDHINLVMTDVSATAGTMFIDSIMTSQGITSLQGKARGKLGWEYPKPILETDGFVFLGNLRTTQRAEYAGDTRLETFVNLDTPGGSSLNYAGTLGLTVSYVDFLIGTSLLSNKDGLSGQASYQIAVPSGIQFPLLVNDSFNADIGIALPYVQKQSAVSLTFPNIVDLKVQTKIIQSDNLLQQAWTTGLGLGDVSSVHGSTNLELTQNTVNSLDQTTWNTYSLPEKLGDAYSWYAPGNEANRLQRSFTWNLGGTLESLPAGLGLSALWATRSDPSAIYTFNTGLDLKTSLRLGEASNGAVLTFTYLRHSLLQETYTGKNFGDEFDQGLGMVGQFTPSWAVIPFYELFDNGSGFIRYSGPYQDALTRPQFSVGITRPLDNTWTSLVIPKQVDAGLARLLERIGNLINDQFILYGSLSWNSLNQFGKVGQMPTFQFYDTDQVDYRFSGGVMLSGGQVRQWQVAPSLSVALYGLAANPMLNDWRLRNASAMGLIEISPPNQIKLSDSFVYRGGLRSMVANNVALDYSWYVDLPDLKYDFMNKKSKEITFLQSSESLEISTNYPSDSTLTTTPVGATLTDLYGFPDISSSDTGLTVAFRHKSYLILPGLAYLSAQLSIGYHRDQVTSIGTAAVQLYIEARVVF